MNLRQPVMRPTWSAPPPKRTHTSFGEHTLTSPVSELVRVWLGASGNLRQSSSRILPPSLRSVFIKVQSNHGAASGMVPHFVFVAEEDDATVGGMRAAADGTMAGDGNRRQ